MIRWLFVLALCPGCGIVQAAQSETVRLSRDTVLQDHFLVPAHTTCIIEPGTRVLFSEYRKFVVKGVLIATATSQQPILISAEGRPAGSTAPPQWSGMVIYGKDAFARLRHVRLEGAYKNIVWQARPEIDSCRISGNHYGLVCMNRAAPVISDCRIYRNVYGVVADFSSPLLEGNIISENRLGLFLQLSAGVVAGKNVFAGNQEDVRTQKGLTPPKESLSLQYLWDLMRDLY